MKASYRNEPAIGELGRKNPGRLIPIIWRWIGVICVLVLPTASAALQSSSDPAKLDLSGYKLTFDEDFDTLDVSAWGPGTRWIAHTPWNGDFGDAAFTDPGRDFPFTVANGILRIEASKDPDNKWRSGLLASQDRQGNGFSQKFGYFEIRAKLPPGPGVWPAFWLNGNTAKDASAEIDVFEYHGHFPDVYEAWVHVWPKAGSPTKPVHEKQTVSVRPIAPDLTSEFHRFGVLVEDDWISFYFDDILVWKVVTPPECKQPLFILLNLALGSGWPIDQTPDPSYMYVDYVRAYSR